MEKKLSDVIFALQVLRAERIGGRDENGDLMTSDFLTGLVRVFSHNFEQGFPADYKVSDFLEEFQDEVDLMDIIEEEDE